MEVPAVSYYTPQILAFSFSCCRMAPPSPPVRWAAPCTLLQLHSSVTLGLLLVTASRFPVPVSKLLCHPSKTVLHSIRQGFCSSFHSASLAHSALSALFPLLVL